MQVLPVRALLLPFDELLKLRGIDETHGVGDLLNTRDHQSLSFLQRLNEIARL